MIHVSVKMVKLRENIIIFYVEYADFYDPCYIIGIFVLLIIVLIYGLDN